MTLPAALATIVFGLWLSAASRAEDITGRYDIPPGDLISALERIANRSKVEFIYSAEDLRGIRTQGVRGQFTVEQAVRELLQGTDLVVTVHPTGAFLVARTQKSSMPLDATRSSQARNEKSVLDTKGASSNRGKDAVAEVLVTASKRLEPIDRVAGGISAISGERLQERGANSLQDYLQFIPGVVLQSRGAPGFGVVTIRGIAAQGVGTATATYVDEVPFGPSSALAESAIFTLDKDPTDLDRVEVLKGPQGTLYGASSLGGLIKYVTRVPNLQDIDVRFQQDLSISQYGSLGEKVSGSVSVPLVKDVIGIRMSGYYLHDGGFIDDVGVGGSHANRGNSRGFHGSVLFQPSGDLSVRVSGITQDDSTHALNVADFDPNTRQSLYRYPSQYRYLTEPFSLRIRLFSTEVKYDMDQVRLVSATSYSQLHPALDSDITATSIAYGYPFASPDTPVGSDEVWPENQWTQELRLVSERVGILEWMAGGFFKHEDLKFARIDTQYVDGVPNAALNALKIERAGTLDEYAGFGNATLYLGSRFDVTAGFRKSHIKQYFMRTASGYLNDPDAPDEIDSVVHHFSENSTTYSAAARYQLTDDTLLYLRASSGYRPGGARTVPPGAPRGFPDFFISDSIWSYETGVKSHTAEGQFSLEADAYWINWNNIQTLEPVPTLFEIYVDGNAGTAVSRGLELQSTFRLSRNLAVGANGAFTDAHFTQTVPGVAVDGARLFFVPRWTGTLYVAYTTPVGNGWNMFAGSDYQYQSSRLDLNADTLSPYGLWNLHMGAHKKNLRLNVYLNNAANKVVFEGYAGGGLFGQPYSFVVNTPRQIGISFAESF